MLQVELKKLCLKLKNQFTIGVRVAVKSGGCAGMSYVMEYAKRKLIQMMKLLKIKVLKFL